MDPSYQNKKIVDLSDEELRTLNFLGQDIAPGVRAIVDKVKAHAENLGSVTCSMIDSLNRSSSAQPPPQDAVASPTISEDDKIFLQLVNDPDDLRVVPPALISKFEKKYWYRGISRNPPELMWRSDLETNPFPIPALGDRSFKIPEKSPHGVFRTPLNAVWDTVAPRIVASMKARGLKYSALKTARFLIVDSDGKESFGPVVVWIAVRPNTTTAAAVRDATPDILQILADFQITDVVNEWYEGSVKRLVGPPLMSIEDKSSPIFGLNHPFNTGLGIPIARESDDAQGTLTFLFREVKTSNGDPSDRILALTNKHVASVDTTTHYEFDGDNPQHIIVCGERRLARAVEEIKGVLHTGLRDAVKLAEELADLRLKSAGKNSAALGCKQTALDTKEKDNATVQMLSDEVQASQWQDIKSRRLGYVDWAPEISVRVDDHHYTRDIATFTVDRTKLVNYKGNIVDLGNQYSADKLKDLFWSIAVIREEGTIPDSLQLPIHCALPRRLLDNPDTEGKNGEPLYIVAKYGSRTKLTLGRYSGMETYTCTNLGLESREVAVYNYSRESDGNFADHGDSGSLIFTGSGDGLAILHSGTSFGADNHVTYGTPLWWVMKQILKKYPFADFNGMTNPCDCD